MDRSGFQSIESIKSTTKRDACPLAVPTECETQRFGQRKVALAVWCHVCNRQKKGGASPHAVEAAHPLAESFNRQNREIYNRIAQAKLFDPYLGRRVRGLLEDAGLTEIDNEGVRRIVRGGEAETRLSCATLQAFMERGILSQTEYAEVQVPFLDPSFSFITRTVYAAWGKRVS